MASWNPRAVLNIYPEDPGFTCSGTTLKGLRCRNSFIKNQYLSEAGDILNTLSGVLIIEHFADEPRLLAILQTLAWLTLCPRWHQKPGRHSQKVSVAYKWLALLRVEYNQRQHPLPSLQNYPSAYSSMTLSRYLQSQSSAAPTLVTSHFPTPPPSSTNARTPSLNLSIPTRSSTYMPTPLSGRRTVASSTPSTYASSPARRTQPQHSNTGIIVSGPIRAAGDVTLSITLNGRTGAIISTPSRYPHGGGIASTSPSQTQIPSLSTLSSPTASDSRRTSSATSSVSATTSNNPITHSDTQTLLNRIQDLESQLQQVTSRRSSRSSRSSRVPSTSGLHTPISSLGVSSNPGIYTPTSSTMSTISDLITPPPTDRAQLFLSPPQSPTTLVRPRHLSISTDSSTPAILTPTSSGPSSPTLLPAEPLPLSPSPPHPPRSVWAIGPRSPFSTLTPRHEPNNITCTICRLSPPSPSTPTPTPTPTQPRCLSLNGCGNGYCTLCISEWIASQLDENRTPSCPSCCAEWVF